MAKTSGRAAHVGVAAIIHEFEHTRCFIRGGRSRYLESVATIDFLDIDALPLESRTPFEWARAVLSDPIHLLIDHAFLEKKAANNAMEMMTRWPGDFVNGWVETMTS